jgi:hypothetical protein
MLLALVQVVEAKAGKVRNKDIARQAAVLEAREMVFGLLESAVQILTACFVLNKKLTLPKEINKPAMPIRLFDWLLEGRDATTRNTEHRKECIPK